MGYRLRVPAELGDWLAELRASAPAAAFEVGASLVALMDAVVVPAPPLVTAAEPDNAGSGDDDPGAAVDRVYQDLLSELQLVRQHVAHIATARKRAELTLSELHGQSDTAPEALAETTRQLHRAQRLEEELTRQSQRLAQAVDGFRTTKEVAKAVYTAAVARRRIQTALGASDSEPDEAEIAAADHSAAQATEQLDALVAQARRLKRAIRSFDAPGDRDREAPSSGFEQPPSPDRLELLALRADALGSDIRVFCAIEPPGTATLLTVLEGPDAIAEDWDQAADAARMLLEVIRDGGWPPYAGEDGGGGLEFADTAAFLSEFFPDDSSAITKRAAELTRSLAELRAHRGMSLADVASATGMSERRLQALEKGDLRHATLHELTAYLRALGGRLEVIADLDGEQRRLG